jgi:hypothetical protein
MTIKQRSLEFVEIIETSPSPKYRAHFGYRNDAVAPLSIPVGGSNKFTPAPADRGQPITFLGVDGSHPTGRYYDAFSIPFGPGEGLPGNQVWTLASGTATASEASQGITPQVVSVEDLGGGMRRVHLGSWNHNNQGTKVQPGMSRIMIVLPPPPAVDGPDYFSAGVRTDTGAIDVPAGATVTWDVDSVPGTQSVSVVAV